MHIVWCSAFLCRILSPSGNSLTEVLQYMPVTLHKLKRSIRNWGRHQHCSEQMVDCTALILSRLVMICSHVKCSPCKAGVCRISWQAVYMCSVFTTGIRRLLRWKFSSVTWNIFTYSVVCSDSTSDLSLVLLMCCIQYSCCLQYF